MTPTELSTPPRPPSPPKPDPTFGEIVGVTLPLVDVVPWYGPPVVFLAGPWLFLSLILAGPFALLVTLVVVLAVAAALVALIGAILAAPYLLFRRLRGYRAGRASMRGRAAQPVAVESPRVAT